MHTGESVVQIYKKMTGNTLKHIKNIMETIENSENIEGKYIWNIVDKQ